MSRDLDFNPPIPVDTFIGCMKDNGITVELDYKSMHNTLKVSLNEHYVICWLDKEGINVKQTTRYMGSVSAIFLIKALNKTLGLDLWEEVLD